LGKAILAGLSFGLAGGSVLFFVRLYIAARSASSNILPRGAPDPHERWIHLWTRLAIAPAAGRLASRTLPLDSRDPCMDSWNRIYLPWITQIACSLEISLRTITAACRSCSSFSADTTSAPTPATLGLCLFATYLWLLVIFSPFMSSRHLSPRPGSRQSRS